MGLGQGLSAFLNSDSWGNITHTCECEDLAQMSTELRVRNEPGCPHRWSPDQGAQPLADHPALSPAPLLRSLQTLCCFLPSQKLGTSLVFHVHSYSSAYFVISSSWEIPNSTQLLQHSA